MPQIAAPTTHLTSLRSRRLPAGVAFYLQVSILLFFLAGSSAPTPLYAIYQARWGFSPITVTVVFGVYAVAVLLALLTVGSLSDHVGRRPVLLGAIVMQAVVMLLFATAGGVATLLVARIVQGLSTGAAVGALGAGLLDLNKTKGPIANGVGALAGTASGALGSGLLVQYLPDPTHVVYLVLFLVFVSQALAVTLMAESASPRAGALASLRPRFSVPAAARRPLLTAVPVLVAAWSLAGFYGSLAPILLRLLTGDNSVLLGGLALFLLAGSGAATVLVLRDTGATRVLGLGAGGLLAGVGVTLLAIVDRSAVAFFIGTAIAGIGFGAGFQGALRTVVPLAAAHERAGVLSVLYLVSYLAMGVPAVLAGVLVVHGGGVMTTAREYAAAVIVLAAVALVRLARGRRGQAAAIAVAACSSCAAQAAPARP